MLATTSRDKKLRFWDVRQERAAHEVPGHSGAKNSRVVWMGEHNRVATTGFSKMSDRQLALWDVGAPQAPLGDFTVLDSMSGVCMPFWGKASFRGTWVCCTDDLQMMELNACILQEREMVTSDTSNTRTTNSSSCPNTSLGNHNEVLPFYHDGALM
jgi:WD40 repeat protein